MKNAFFKPAIYNETDRNEGIHMMSNKVLVIGGGVAGLSAASELAELDIDVEIVDQSDFPGGHAIQYACKATDQCVENWIDLYPTKMNQIRAAGAGMLVVPCHSCHGQFNSIKKEYGMEDLDVKYLWELVADCMII